MTDKKALIHNTLQAIIAIVGIALLFFAAYQIYIKATYNQPVENAKTLADIIETKINSLKEGEKNTFLFQGISSENSGWFISGWGKDSPNLPDKCFPDGCICICKNSEINNIESAKNVCDETGICRKFQTKNILIQNYKAREKFLPSTGNIGSTQPRSGKYEEVITQKIFLPKNFFQIEIEKTENSITLIHFTQSYIDNKNKIE